MGCCRRMRRRAIPRGTRHTANHDEASFRLFSPKKNQWRFTESTGAACHRQHLLAGSGQRDQRRVGDTAPLDGLDRSRDRAHRLYAFIGRMGGEAQSELMRSAAIDVKMFAWNTDEPLSKEVALN